MDHKPFWLLYLLNDFRNILILSLHHKHYFHLSLGLMSLQLKYQQLPPVIDSEVLVVVLTAAQC
jgi:hypothetical protein